MKETITALIQKFGNQRKAAIALGITDRTFRNYVKKPDCVPEPMRRLMMSILEQEGILPVQPSMVNGKAQSLPEQVCPHFQAV